MKLAITTSLALAIAGASASAFAGTVTVEQHGGRSVRVFVPTTPATPTPLVVMLHGCTQTADGFADATRMDVLAEQNGFVVAYPEQSSDTIPTKCFQWYEPAHQARDAGEPKSLADATDAIAKAHGVDLERVYVAGISAGAAMSVILGATYPDRFTAIGVIAGVEYKGAASAAEGFSVTQSGGPDPEQQGTVAHTQMGARARAVPTFVLHGTADGVLAKINGDQVATQWRKTNTLVLGEGAIDPVKSQPGNAGYPFTRMLHANKANGASVVEYYVVDGLGHAWPGGKNGGSYSDAKGPDASALLWAFFKGRTLKAPLDVPPPAAPGSPGLPGTSADGGTSTPPGLEPDPANPGASPAAASDDGSDGCGVRPSRASDAPGSLAASLLAIAILVASQRARRRP